VKFTRRKTTPNYSMEIPVKPKIFKEIPTVPVLPPIQAVVAAAKRRSSATT
jgi:hypothetical protein